MASIASKDLLCEHINCTGKIELLKVTTKCYGCTIEYKCMTCQAIRYMCEICSKNNDAQTRRDITKIIHRSRLYRHHGKYHRIITEESVSPSTDTYLTEL